MPLSIYMPLSFLAWKLLTWNTYTQMFNSREVKDGFVFLPFEVSDHAKLWSLHWWQMGIGPGSECENGRILRESIWKLSIWLVVSICFNDCLFSAFFNPRKGMMIPADKQKILCFPQPVMGHGLIRMKYGNCYSFFEPGPPIVFYVFLVDAMAHRPWFFHLLSGAKRKLSWQGRLLQAVCMNSARWVDVK